MSENSSQAPTLMRSKSRTDMSGASSRYQNLSYWKARKLIFYRNGDPFFPGIEYRFKPGRDVNSLETLLDKISPKMDLPRGARYVFSMDGDRKYTLDELEDGASYVLSSLKVFKVSERVSSFDSLKFVGSKTVLFFRFFYSNVMCQQFNGLDCTPEFSAEVSFLRRVFPLSNRRFEQID